MSRSPSPRLTWVLMCALSGVLCAPASASGQRRAAADLVVRSVTLAGPLAQDRETRVSEITANIGRVRSARSWTSYHLSADRRLDRGDVAVGGHRVRPLAPGEKRRTQ